LIGTPGRDTLAAESALWSRPVKLMILGLALFLGVHSIRIFGDGWRARLVKRIGLLQWKAVYSVASLAGFVLLVIGFGAARQAPVVLWVPPAWLKHVAMLLTVPAFVLLAAAYVPGTRIRKVVGHPMVAGVKSWAFAHLLANGALHDVVLFGAFLVWAIVDYIASLRRDRAEGRVYVTGPASRDALAVIIGLGAWAVFAFWLHGVLIGVRPLG
jgi:uncharacterized membrane protein